jgi:putative ABC transport system permease protein
VTLAAVAFGATAVIYAFGLHSSLTRAREGQTLSATVPVQVQPVGPGAGPDQLPSGGQVTAAAAAITAQPGTAHENAEYGAQVKVVGITQDVNALVYAGPTSWMGYAQVSGHWYDAPGEADVNTVFLPGTAVPGNLWQWNIGLQPGTTAAAYTQAVDSALGSHSPFQATGPDGGQFYVIAIGLVGLLSLMVAVAAGLGVLNTVPMTTRDRVHDLGVFKSLGMRPGQVMVMVICWVIGPAVLAAAIAAPAAVALNTATLHAMAATAHTGIPAQFTDVLPVPRLALLSLAAVAIAVLGALLPATWAARARPATALRAE